MQGGVATTKTVDTITGTLIGFSVADLSGLSITDGGTVNTGNMLTIIGFTPSGGSITVNELYGVNIASAFGSFATDSWGFFNNSDTENYFKKSLAIGTTSTKVTNSDIAFEIGSLKAFRHGRLTTTERDALSALEGMEIFNTTTNQVEYYDGAAWVCGCGGNVDGGTSSSVYGGTTAIDGGGA
jgi:hypothetical protein